jgi:N,N-dimethylformamidase
VIPLTGYTDRLSAAPGERIAFKVSSTARGPYRASLARVVHADPNPAGPGIKIEDLAHRFSIERPSRAQPLALGSYARVDAAAGLSLRGPLTVSAIVWPTLAGASEQCVMSRWDERAGAGWALSVGPGGVRARLSMPGLAPITLAGGVSLELRRWYRVWLVADPAAKTLRVGHVALSGGTRTQPHETTAPLPSEARRDAPAPILIGARLAPEPREHWNGKIEDPLILGVAARAPETLALDPLLPPAGLVAGWDFSQGIEGLDVVDIGPHRLGGRLVNLPTRAVTGARWSGSEMCWRHAPREYAAIHFHDDDIYDAGWATDFEFTVPDDMPSGAYLMRLAADGHVEELPFYVRPSRAGGKRTCSSSRRPTPIRPTPIMPAATATRPFASGWRRGAPIRTIRTIIPSTAAPPTTGIATAAASATPRACVPCSPCGRAISPSSTRAARGCATIRPTTHLLDWLEGQGIAFDVVTDEDVDAEGAALLAPYRVVLTGSHPEYHTVRTHDAHAGYLEGGGARLSGRQRLLLAHRDQPGLARRHRGPPRGDGHPRVGGAGRRVLPRPRRHVRRPVAAQWAPPQQLVGVGSPGQGLFEGSYYRRQPGADDPRAAWILAGVDEAVIGDFGLSGGGAAGFEVDRADAALGTPAGAIVVASSEGHGPSFVVVFEDLLSHLASATGERPSRMIRADMTYAELPGGGAIFAVGSITFCGSLSHNRYDNNVSRILRNVIERFRKPR